MEQKHSSLGIASIITNIVVIFMIAILFVVPDLYRPLVGQIPLSIIYFVFVFMSLVALGVGIAGLIQKDRKKLFAILGTIFSVLMIGAFLCLGSLLILQLSFGM